MVIELFLIAAAVSNAEYFLGETGQSCTEVCYKRGMDCNPRIITNNSSEIFKQLGSDCVPDARAWWATNQPGVVTNSSDPNFHKCLGYTSVPGGVLCSGAYPTVSRVCRCDAADKSQRVFGTGLSNGAITTTEQWIFNKHVVPGDVGVMTHFWITYMANADDGVIIRYYVDGEATPSIQFTPSQACGVGFYDNASPWGTKWFGKGAKDGAWHLNFRIPFQKSILVTAQHTSGSHNFYMIVRGTTNLPINIGDIVVPTNARLQLFNINKQFPALTYIDLANVPKGKKGVHFMSTLIVESGNMNFLEGCYHMYTGAQEFPGTILSTGTEDYFDSAWYFNAGEFHLPVSGFTHLVQKPGNVRWSSYRFHEMDPLVFDDGYRFVWRVGDTDDVSGIKCMMDVGGIPAGSPTASNVTSLVWVYTWN